MVARDPTPSVEHLGDAITVGRISPGRSPGKTDRRRPL